MLTTSPVDIGPDSTELIFTEKVEAITGGASLYVDITSYILSNNVIDAFNEIEKKYPEGCVKAELYGENEKKVVLDWSSGAWASDNVQLRLTSKKGVPVDTEFVSLKISSCKEIKNTVVKWRNYSE